MSKPLLRSAPESSGRAPAGRIALRLLLGFLVLSLTPCPSHCGQAAAAQPATHISKIASNSCSQKVKALETSAAAPARRKKQATRFSEEEINSYLALELKSRYHPSLRSLELTFEDNSLQGEAAVDFDKLSMNSTKFITKMLAKLFSGVHNLSFRGKLVTHAGKGNFELEEAHFDSSVLPNFLVEQVISAVGQKQRPPFDPMQPSKMPYDLDKVEVHRGYIVVYQ